MPPFRSVALRALSLAAFTLGFAVPVAFGQLRVVSYNTAENAPSSLTTIFRSIGEQTRNGIAKQVDIIALQEQTTPGSTTQSIVDLLNGFYGPGVYDRSSLLGASFGSGRPTLIYNTETVELIAESVATNATASGGPRQTLRYQLRPAGYDESADFYLYNSHYKASNSSSDRNRRNVEATQVRANADALGEGARIIYAGDLNLYTSQEAAYQTLLAAGPGQAIDPLNPTNAFQPWDNSSTFSTFHTQSPCSGCGGVGGGIDSRFDFQLSSGEVNDAEGLSIIADSYHAFGNNGTTFNQPVNASSNTVTFPGVTSFTRSQIISALATTTDHLPLVADYQVPAVVGATTDPVPETLDLGVPFALDFSVFNDADAVAFNGADELNYTISVTGDLALIGSDSGVDIALGGGNDHEVFFDTFTPGVKSGEIIINSSSQSAANNGFTIDINYEVIAAVLAGDYNDDGVVDAADYTTYRDAAGGIGSLLNETASPGAVDVADFNAWAAAYADSASSTAIPEPSGASLLLLGAVVARGRRAVLKDRSRG